MCRPLQAQPAAPPQAVESGAADPAPSGDLKMVAAVACTKYDDLVKDVDFIGSLIGQPNISQGLEGQIGMMTGGKGLAGIDKTKPWGLILQTDGSQFLPIVCLPVTKADDVLGAAAALGAEIKPGEGGVTQLTLPDGNNVFAKNAGGWMYLSRNQASLARLPSNPETAFSRLLSDYDLAAQVKVQNVPPMYRNLAVLTVQSAMQQQLQRQPDESDEQFVERQQALQAQMQQTVQQIQELDSLTFGWLVDAPRQRSVLEFTYRFVPDGKLAKQFAAYGEPRTNFAGFRQEGATASANLVTKADPEAIKKDLAQLETMMTGARAQFNTSVDENGKDLDEAKRKAIKAAGGLWFDAMEETMKSGQIDGAASLNVTPGSLALVAAVRVEDSAKFEEGLKAFEAEFKDSPDFPGVKWNADSQDGINFHTMTVSVPASDEAHTKLLGDKLDLAFGVGPQAIYFGAGPDNVAALKKAIDASKADPNKLVAPFELKVALAPIMEVVAAQANDDPERAKAQALATMLKTGAPGRDHISIVGQMVPNGLRYRIEAEEGVLRAFGKAALEARQQAAAAAAAQPPTF